MDYLVKMYKEKCKEEFSHLGFKCYRRNFYRVVNDMFQSFDLQKSVSGRDCVVHFVVVPMCVGETIKKTYCGPNHIKRFEKDPSWFEYDRNDEDSMDNCVDEMIGYMKKYLIPYFQLCDNSKQAYYATCEFQQKNYREGIFLADPYLYYMALKGGLYDRALEHLIAWKNHTESAYKTNTECFGVDVEYRERIQRKIRELDYQIKMISENNLQNIQNYIDERERIAQLNLGIKTRIVK